MICIDASVVGTLISSDESVEKINRLYEQARFQGEKFIAPSLLQFEVASLLSKKRRQGLLTNADALAAVFQFKELGIEFSDFEDIIERCLALTDVFEPSLTVYDASYLAVAEKNKARLWTADKEFFKTVSATFRNAEFILG